MYTTELAQTKTLIPLAQSQLIKSNCVNNTTVLQIQCFVKSWPPTTRTKAIEHGAVRDACFLKVYIT